MMSLRNTEKEVFIKAPWGKIAALTWGNPNNPPVLLATGRLVPCTSFESLVLKLPQNFYYISFDFPGNGTSDHLPKGVRFTAFDLVPSLLKVSEHFKCEKFIYIAHSLGTLVGKYFNMAYPGRMTRVVEIDPVPSYLTVLPEDMGEWYTEIYGNHYEDRAYKIHTSSNDGAPKYGYDKVKEILLSSQSITNDTTDFVKARYVTKDKDGLYRFTHDQRMKSTYRLPVTPDNLKQMYTRSDVPTLAIFATKSIELGAYRRTPFAMDEKAWPHRNYRCKVVKGDHNVYILDPEAIAGDISKFLLETFKAKL